MTNLIKLKRELKQNEPLGYLNLKYLYFADFDLSILTFLFVLPYQIDLTLDAFF